MAESLYGLLHGLGIAFLPINLLYTLVGVFIGTMISHLPGIGPSAGIALILPVTYGMDPTTALIMLAGIYYGCMYGGAVTAILLNTPGDAAAVMTTLDGYPMAQKGRAGAALAIAAISSFIAGTIGVTALTFVAAPLAQFSLRFGPTEFFSLILFALSTVGALTGDSTAKGLLSVFIGMALASVGADPQSGVPRFTFDSPYLLDGISFLVAVVGIFAIAEVSRMVESAMQGTLRAIPIQGRIWFTRAEWLRARFAILRGTAIGFACGAAPGLGGTIAAMLAYVAEKKVSRRPQEFGTGAVEGVAAPEAAVNADTCGAFVHLLALGIPASGATAVIMGAFIMNGLTPGPLLFQDHPDTAWGLIASMYVGNLMLVVLNLPLVGVFAKILYVPPGILMVLILAIASAGVYSFHQATFDLYLALGFGVLGYAFRRLDIPKTPLIFGLILEGRLEQAFRQATTLSGGSLWVFAASPISATLLALAAVSLGLSFWSRQRRRRGLVHLAASS